MPERRSEKSGLVFRTGRRIAAAIIDYVGQIPPSKEHARPHPEVRAHAIADAAARQAGMTSGGLTLPPGPLGWLTLLPEMRALLKLQTQMVADIAACYGKSDQLGREAMTYCLFRHTDAQVVRDLVSQIGKRQVVQRAARPDLQAVSLKIGMHISQRLIGKGISRWIPVVGALGAGIYAYYDTRQVARTAMELFTHIIDVTGEAMPADAQDHDQGARRSR